jgi:hypothetical protein
LTADLFGPGPMPAISLHQPWASLVAIGAKRYETRHWRAPARLIGQRVAIHAAARAKHPPLEDDSLKQIYAAFGGRLAALSVPRGAIVCTATLAGVERVEDVPHDAFGDYSPGRFAWRLDDVRALAEPVAVKGRQGWFRWTPPAGAR